MSEVDFDCWQHKLGLIEGCLRAYSAPPEIFATVEWMKQQLECDETESRLDRLLDSAKAPPAVERTKLPKFTPIDNIDDEDSIPKSGRKKREKIIDNGIAASEPPANRLGIPEWGASEPDENPDDPEVVITRKEHVPLLNPKTDEPKRRGWSSGDEEKIISMLGGGKGAAEILMEFPEKNYGNLYAKITALKAAGRT